MSCVSQIRPLNSVLQGDYSVSLTVVHRMPFLSIYTITFALARYVVRSSERWPLVGVCVNHIPCFCVTVSEQILPRAVSACHVLVSLYVSSRVKKYLFCKLLYYLRFTAIIWNSVSVMLESKTDRRFAWNVCCVVDF